MKPTHDYESLEKRISALEKERLPAPRMPVTSASARAQSGLDRQAMYEYARKQAKVSTAHPDITDVEAAYLAGLHAERAHFAVELDRPSHPDAIMARLRARCGLSH